MKICCKILKQMLSLVCGCVAQFLALSDAEFWIEAKVGLLENMT
jgi:hypothetical protein